MSTNNNKRDTSESGMTQVKTTYARAAVMLLSLNFLLTGYVVLNLNSYTQQQIDERSRQTATSQEAAPQRQTLQTLETIRSPEKSAPLSGNQGSNEQ